MTSNEVRNLAHRCGLTLEDVARIAEISEATLYRRLERWDELPTEKKIVVETTLRALERTKKKEGTE